MKFQKTIVIQRRRIKEAHDRKPEDPTHYEAKDILIKSMNVGTSMLAEKMGAAAFLNYIQSFGFGDRTSIYLPGETSGLVRSLSQIAPIDNAVMSFGQGISVTSLQMTAAVAAIGNNGMYIRPRIIKHQTDHNNLTISHLGSFRQRRVVSSKTAQLVRAAMEDVVAKGTGRYAQVKGYRIGGKTGTAQNHWKMGAAMRRMPTLLHLLVYCPFSLHAMPFWWPLTSHKQRFGVQAAAPLFSEVAKVMIDYYDIEPTITK